MATSNYFAELYSSTFATGKFDSFPDLTLELITETADNEDTTENPDLAVSQSARGKCYNHPLIDLC